jgi:hypothetical protein
VDKLRGQRRPSRNFFNLHGSCWWRCHPSWHPCSGSVPEHHTPTVLVGDGSRATGRAPVALLVPSLVVMAVDTGTSADVAACHILSVPRSPSSSSPPPGDVGPASGISTAIGGAVSGMRVSSKAEVAPLVLVRPSSLVGTAMPVLPRPLATLEGCRTSDNSAL